MTTALTISVFKIYISMMCIKVFTLRVEVIKVAKWSCYQIHLLASGWKWDTC